MEAKLSTKLLEKILPQHIIRQLNSGVKCVANDHPEVGPRLLPLFFLFPFHLTYRQEAQKRRLL